MFLFSFIFDLCNKTHAKKKQIPFSSMSVPLYMDFLNNKGLDV